MKQVIFMLAAFLWIAVASASEIPALAYHDIVEQKDADPFSVTAKDFARQLEYLRKEGYTPVSLKLLDQVRAGNAKLPPKPVLLTFDDGLQSYAERAVPLLKEYGFPSVLSVVTGWVDGATAPESYRGRLLGWDSLRALAASPLIEIISHSHDLHRGVRSNPQGNEAAAGVARVYDAASGNYETEDARRARVSADLARSHDRLLAMLGKPPAAIAWPYGAYDGVLVEQARRLGMVYHLTLDGDPTSLEMLPRINRLTFMRYQGLRDLDGMLNFRKTRRAQLRFIEVSLDAFAGKNAAEQERILSSLLSRIQLLGVNAVLVDPFTSDRRAAFFPNRELPVAANVLNRVMHQIKSRNERIEYVFLRLPGDIAIRDRVGMYRELARLHRFQGVVFVSGGEGGKENADIEAIFRESYPGVKIIYASTQAGPASGDYRLIELDAQMDRSTLARGVKAAAGAGPNSLFLLKRSNQSSERLVSALRSLRAAGAVHYGYTNDEMEENNWPALRQLARELTAHTVPEASR